MARRRRAGSAIYVASLVLHAGVAAAVVNIDEQVVHEATSVTIQEVKKTPKKVDEPKPPPPPPSEEQVRKVARTKAKPVAAPPPPAPAPAAAEAAPAAAAPVADFGLSLSGGVGAGGVAVPQGNSMRSPVERTTRIAGPKVLVPTKPSESPVDACLEALIKPKPLSTPQPAYADRAREAGIQGKVRVELTVDATGAVVSARVLESLGYGLDEAALEAAKSWRFEAATRCGKATSTTFVVGIRFTL